MPCAVLWSWGTFVPLLQVFLWEHGPGWHGAGKTSPHWAGCRSPLVLGVAQASPDTHTLPCKWRDHQSCIHFPTLINKPVSFCINTKASLTTFFSLLEFTNTCCAYLLLASLYSVAVFCGQLHPSPLGHGLFVSAWRAGGSLVQSCFRQLLSVKLFLPGCCDRAPEAGRVSVLSGTKNTS